MTLARVVRAMWFEIRLAAIMRYLGPCGAIVVHDLGDPDFLRFAADALPGRRIVAFEPDADSAKSRVTIEGADSNLLVARDWRSVVNCVPPEIGLVVSSCVPRREMLSFLRSRFLPGAFLVARRGDAQAIRELDEAGLLVTLEWGPGTKICAELVPAEGSP